MCMMIQTGHYWLFPFSPGDQTAHIIYKKAACVDRYPPDSKIIQIPRDQGLPARFDKAS